jgi:hypothetical protein
MPTVPNLTVLEARDEATSDISRWPKKRSGAATLRSGKLLPTRRTLLQIDDRGPRRHIVAAVPDKLARFVKLNRSGLRGRSAVVGGIPGGFSFLDILSRNWLPERPSPTVPSDRAEVNYATPNVISTEGRGSAEASSAKRCGEAPRSPTLVCSALGGGRPAITGDVEEGHSGCSAGTLGFLGLMVERGNFQTTGIGK